MLRFVLFFLAFSFVLFADLAQNLHEAICKQDLDRVRAIIRTGCDLEKTNEEGLTALDVAMLPANLQQRPALAQAILDAGAKATGAGKSPMPLMRLLQVSWLCDFTPYSKLCESLLLKGALVDEVANGQTCLTQAVLSRVHYNTLTLLIEYGADCNAINSDGKCPLLLAAEWQEAAEDKEERDEAAQVVARLRHPNYGGAKEPVYASDRSQPAPLLTTLDADKKLASCWLYFARRGNLMGLKGFSSDEVARLKEVVDGFGRTALHLASMANHKACVDYLLTLGLDPDAVDYQYQTPAMLLQPAIGQTKAIHRAYASIAAVAQPGSIWSALRLDADLSSLKRKGITASAPPNRFGQSPLFFLDCMSLDNAQQLLDWGFDPNASDVFGQTPMHTLLTQNAIDVASDLSVSIRSRLALLLSYGAKLDVRDKLGNTPLASYYAARQDALLAGYAVGPEVHLDVWNAAGETALTAAILAGHTEFSNAELIDMDLYNSSKQTALGLCLEKDLFPLAGRLIDLGANVGLASYDTSLARLVTPLEYAALHRNLAFLNTVLEKAPYLQVYFDPSYYILSAASGPFDFLEALIERGGNIFQIDASGKSPLLLAVEAKCLDNVLLLLAKGALVGLPDHSGNTALMLAAQTKDAALVGAILGAKGDTLPVNYKGQTALAIATEGGSVDVVRALLAAGAPVDFADQLGQTPLMLASSSGNTELARVLLEAGANPDAVNRQGNTAMHLAAKVGHLESVKLLADFKASYSVQNRDHENPLAIAQKSGQLAVAEFIIQQTATPSIWEWIRDFCLIGTGLVIFLIGLEMISNTCRRLFGPRLKALANKALSTKPRALIAGFLSSATTGSDRLLTFVMNPLLRMAVISKSGAMIAQVWAELGGFTLLFVSGFDLEPATVVLVGILGALYMLEKPESWLPYIGIPAGLGMLMFGMSFITDTATELAQTPAISKLMHFATLYPALAVLVSFGLTVAFQSDLGVGMTIQAFAVQGCIQTEIAFLMYAGLTLGWAVNVTLMQGSFSGPMKMQSKILQYSQYSLAVFICVDYCIEQYLGVPLLIAASKALFGPSVNACFLCLLVMVEVLRGLTVTIFAEPLLRFFQKRSLLSADDKLDMPTHIDLAGPPVAAPEALILFEKENTELIKRLKAYLDLVRNADSRSRLDTHHDGFVGVCQIVSHFYKRLTLASATEHKQLGLLVQELGVIISLEKHLHELAATALDNESPLLTEQIARALAPLDKLIDALLARNGQHPEVLEPLLQTLAQTGNLQELELRNNLQQVQACIACLQRP